MDELFLANEECKKSRGERASERRSAAGVVLRVESHIINNTHPFFSECDRVCFASKNLYNAINYYIRQEYFEIRDENNRLYEEWQSKCTEIKLQNEDIKSQNKTLSKKNKIQLLPLPKKPKFNKQYTRQNLSTLYSHVSKNMLEYRELPTNPSDRVINHVLQDWRSYWASIKDYRKNPEKYKGEPRPPRYYDKVTGRCEVTYFRNRVSKKQWKKEHLVIPSQTEISLLTKVDYQDLVEVKIVPVNRLKYKIQIAYEKKLKLNTELDYSLTASNDLGCINVITLTSDKPGFQPIIVNGRRLCYINAKANKLKASLQSALPQGVHTSKAILQCLNKHEQRLNNEMHHISKYVVDVLVENHIGNLIIGYNEGWKGGLSLGKITNQKFMFIPFKKLIAMITYKCQMVGINVILQEESYTSKASFLDYDFIPTYEEGNPVRYTFSGRRIKRGLYQRSTVHGRGSRLNADVQGSYNILRKSKQNTSSAMTIDCVGAVGVHPVKVDVVKVNSRVNYKTDKSRRTALTKTCNQ